MLVVGACFLRAMPWVIASCFYSLSNGGICFASESKAILALQSHPTLYAKTVARITDSEARCRDSEATIFAGIRALPSATLMALDENGARQTQFWRPNH